MALGTANDGQCNQENTLNKSEKSHIDPMPTSNAMDENNPKKGRIRIECVLKVFNLIVALFNENTTLELYSMNFFSKITPGFNMGVT